MSQPNSPWTQAIADAQAQTAATEPAPTSPAESGTDTANPADALPDWAKKELTEARGDAAKYRTQLREVEAKLASAKSQEDIDAAVAELKATNATLARELLLAKVSKGLPEELVPLLKGDTEEELAASAELLRKHLGGTKAEEVEEDTKPAPTQLRGGKNPAEDPASIDPVAIATKFMSGGISPATVSGHVNVRI